MPIYIATLGICLEYVPELFIGRPFKYEVPDSSGYVFDTTWKDPIWYTLMAYLVLTVCLYVFSLVPKRWIAVKIISMAPIVWWAIELYQKVCWMFQINDSRLYVDKSSQWQIFIVLFIIVGGVYGLLRHKS